MLPIQTSLPLTFDVIQRDDDKVMFYTDIPNGGSFRALFDEMSDMYDDESDRTKRGRPRA